MAIQRTRIAVNVGNVLELVGAGVGCWAVDRLAGLSWSLIAAALVLIVGAELIYDGHMVRFPLPRRPHPVRRVRRSLGRHRSRP